MPLNNLLTADGRNDRRTLGAESEFCQNSIRGRENMTGTTMLYHPVHAPDGQPFATDSGNLTSYADEGWVDDPAKIGVNPWGEDHRHAVAKRHLEYLSGDIPGISPEYGTDEGQRCVIWNTLATDVSEPGRDGFTLDSPRACGRYFISGSAAAMVESRNERLKARLTTWLVDQRRLGNRFPEVMTSSIDDAGRYQDLTVRQRVDRLLRFIAEQTPGIGAAFSLTNQKTTCAAMAWSESTHMKEVRFLLNYIQKRGWLEADDSARDQYVLTIDAHARLAELEGRDTGSSRAFVAMWFLLIRDTPHVRLYVLNMFRMRGSRLWGSRLHRACVV